MLNNIILIFAIALAVILGGLFSGAETGIYQLSRLRLRLGIEKKQFLFITLGQCLHDSPALLISILIGTNLSTYFVTSVVTFLLLTRLDVPHTAELLTTLITAPALFIFSELVPKNLFFYRADSLMPPVAPVLLFFKQVCMLSGLTGLLKGLSCLAAKLSRVSLPSRTAVTSVRESHIKAILQETGEEALLSPVQTDIINRISTISSLSITAVMTPLRKIRMVDMNSDKSVLMQNLAECAFTRLPVYHDSPVNITGFINIYDCLTSSDVFSDLRQFTRPIRRLAADTAVIDAMNIMQNERQKIVLVTRAAPPAPEKPVGIVTMKDLVEELLGELAEW